MEERRDALATLVDAALAIEKLRVAVQLRQSHLARQGRKDPETDELLRRLKDMEEYADGRVSDLIKHHPAYPWFSRVKGVGAENIAKVVAAIDIHKAPTISSLWKFSGRAPQDGHAPKRTRGEKLPYNSQLRAMTWRLGTSLLRARGKFYQKYLSYKDAYYQRFLNQGYRIVPASALPRDRNGRRYEAEGVISEGHIHNLALNKMIKLFEACLWLVWREAEGLPLTRPYAIDKLGHNSFIDPWEMVDR